MTKKAKVEQFDAVARERDNFMCALHDVLNNQVTWGEWVKEHDGAGKYRAGLSRETLLLLTFRHPNQSDHTTAYDLDSELVRLRYLRIGSETWEPVLQAIRNAQQKAQVAA